MYTMTMKPRHFFLTKFVANLFLAVAGAFAHNDPRLSDPPISLLFSENDQRNDDALAIASVVVASSGRECTFYRVPDIDRKLTLNQAIQGVKDYYEKWKPTETLESLSPTVLAPTEASAGDELRPPLEKLAKRFKRVQILSFQIC
jgi:hypothetical protein